MKTSLFASMLLSTLFYTTLLSMMFAVPLVLAVRYHAGMATVDQDARMWERPPYAPARVGPHHDLLLPQSDASVSGPAAKQAPMDQSGPDAAMIRPGRARAKTIKL
jgi:hypothetical protein